MGRSAAQEITSLKTSMQQGQRLQNKKQRNYFIIRVSATPSGGIAFGPKGVSCEKNDKVKPGVLEVKFCLLYTSPSPRDDR